MCRWLWSRCCCCWRRRRRGKFEYKSAGRGDAEKFFKLVLVGGRVGKTALRHKFARTDAQLDAPAASVSETDYSVRDMNLGGEAMNIQIYECPAGGKQTLQETQGQATMSSLQLADGIFLVYDVTRGKSLTRLKEIMLSSEVLPHLCRAGHVLVVGAKNDLDDGERDVSKEEGKAFADRIGAGFVETSAKTGESVSKALFLMVASVSENSGRTRDKNSTRRLKMPWTDPARLRESFSRAPRRTFSAQALGLSLLGAPDHAELSFGDEQTATSSDDIIRPAGELLRWASMSDDSAADDIYDESPAGSVGSDEKLLLPSTEGFQDSSVVKRGGHAGNRNPASVSGPESDDGVSEMDTVSTAGSIA